MKKRSQALETVVHGVFLLLGLITVGCVLLISVYPVSYTHLTLPTILRV